MEKKKLLFGVLFMLITLPLCAGEHEILIKEKPGPNTGSRTINGNSVSASYDDQNRTLTICFSDETASCVYIYSSTSHAPMIQENVILGYRTQVDASSLPIGEYIIEIYAFDCWWIGYFEID